MLLSMTSAEAEKARATYIELCALCPTEADRTLLAMPKWPAIHPLSPVQIAGTVLMRAAVTSTVFVDGGGEDDTETGWETHADSGGFGASVAQAASRTPATRQIETTPAVYGASVPRPVAEIGHFSLQVAAWMLVTFEAAELLAMRALMPPLEFCTRIVTLWEERPQYRTIPCV